MTLARYLAWRVHLFLRRPVTVELPPWQGRLFLPADWGSVGTTMIYCLREPRSGTSPAKSPG